METSQSSFDIIPPLRDGSSRSPPSSEDQLSPPPSSQSTNSRPLKVNSRRSSAKTLSPDRLVKRSSASYLSSKRSLASPVSKALGLRYLPYIKLPPSLVAGYTEEGDDEEIKMTLRKYSALVEYSCVQSQSPSGVYVMPSISDPREWHCVVFVRQGWYRGAVFRFNLTFGPDYPEKCPKVSFISPLPYHPLVHPENGELCTAAGLSDWSAKDFSSLHALAFTKRIFYVKEYLLPKEESLCFNKECVELYQSSPKDFLDKIDGCIKQTFSDSFFSPFPTPEKDDETPSQSFDIHFSKFQPSFREIAKAFESLGGGNRMYNGKDVFIQWMIDEYIPHQFEEPSEGSFSGMGSDD